MKLLFKEKSIRQGNVTEFIFEPIQSVTWKAGQYTHFTIPHQADDRGDERWFTISSAPSEREIHITTRINTERSSTFKQELMKLQPGDAIEADEPSGDFILSDTDRHYIFIIGGIGITPIRSILKQLDVEGKGITAKLLYANRDETSIAYKDELEELSQRYPNFTIINFIAENRIDNTAIIDAASDLSNPLYYVSGPEPMVEQFETTLTDMGVDKDNIKFDYFPGYEKI